MSGRNYYVTCDSNCKFPAMTKEQTLAAITEAISTGKITDVDTGFITKLKEQNGGRALMFWIGTRAEYNALTTKQDNCCYILTDDTTGEDLDATIKEILNELDNKAPFGYVDGKFNEAQANTNTKFDNVLTYLNAFPNVRFGSYTGSGKAGKDYPNILNLDIDAVVIFLFEGCADTPPAIWRKGIERIYSPTGTNWGYVLKGDVTEATDSEGKTIDGAFVFEWYADRYKWQEKAEENADGDIVGTGVIIKGDAKFEPEHQYNYEGETYYYLAFGL